jgi:hypothetical protein
VPYLHLKIPKRKLVNFLNIRAIFSAFNIFPMFLFFPFILMNVMGVYGGFAAFMYMLAVVSLSVFNNYLALYVKRLSISNTRFVIIGFLVLIALGLLEYFKVFSIAAISNEVFTGVSKQPLIALVFPLIAVAVFKLNANYLRKNLYMEELHSGEEKKGSTDYPFLDRYGAAGQLAALEIKLILRNKRSKSTVSKGLLFIFYGLLFYKQKELDHDGQYGVAIWSVYVWLAKC